MASVQTSKYDGRYLKLTVIEESTSIENNTSTIRWTLESIGGNSNYYNVYSVEVKINNVTKYGPTTKTWDSKTFPAAKGSTTGTVTIEHNADGTASPLQFSLRGSVYNNNPQTYSDSLTLSTIPRASTVSVPDANIGSNTNIAINKASSSFTTTLRYRALRPNETWTDWTTIISQTSLQVYGWTVPTSLYSLIPNNQTIKCEIEATTFSSGTQIGSPTYTQAIFTATGSPVINSCSLVSTDSTTTNLVGSSRMIRYISTVQATVSASGQNSASISSIVVNGVTANSSGVATFPNATTYSYNVTVTDSRGYSTSNTYAITWTNYIPLTLNATIKRNEPTDGIIDITYDGNYFNGSFRTSSDTYVANTLSVQYRVRPKDSSWTDWRALSPTIPSGANSYSQTNYQISGYSYTGQYEFEIQATDRVQNTLITGITVTKGRPIFNWRDGYFNVNGKSYVNNKQLIGGYNLDLSSLSTSNFYPVTFDCGIDILDCEIHSQSGSSVIPYNQNVIHYRQMAAGWSDTPRTLQVITYDMYDNSEITIGCIGCGETGSYEHVVWLRGGLTYNVNSNYEPFLHTSDYTSSGSSSSTYTVGTNYYGGANSNVIIQFTPQSTIITGTYFNGNLRAYGHISTDLAFSDYTTNSLNNFKSYVLTNNIKYGTTLISCNFNGAHLSAIVEKANNNYLSFILFNYDNLMHYRYYNGTWYNEQISKTPIQYGTSLPSSADNGTVFLLYS